MAKKLDVNKTPKTPDAEGKTNKENNTKSQASTNNDAKVWNVGALFWGLLLVLVGAILLLDNLEILEADWSNLWRLWPLAVIATGFSLLAPRGWFWKALSLLFIVASLLVVGLVATGSFDREGVSRANEQTNTVSVEENAQKAEVSIEAGASKLRIAPGETDELVSTRLYSEALELKHDSEINGNTQSVTLSADSRRKVWFMRGQSEWDVTLTRKLPLSVSINAGASAIDADFSKVLLDSLTLNAGASSLVLTLGNLRASQNITLDNGASSVTVRVPKDSGVKISIDGGLTKKDLGDPKELTENVYASDGYNTAKNKIDLNADLGAASIKLQRY